MKWMTIRVGRRRSWLVDGTQLASGLHVFRNLSEVREHAEQWLADYNIHIPHDSQGGSG